MKESLVEYLACPVTGKTNIKLEVYKSIGSEIIEGKIEIGDRLYPIIKGVPRLLPDEFMNNLRFYHGSFLKKHPVFNDYIPSAEKLLSDIGSEKKLAIMRTLKFYSFVHQQLILTEIDKKVQKDFSSFFKMRMPFERNYFKSKVGLDAGCGEGRYSNFIARNGGEIISLDLSEAVNRAFKNNIGVGKNHVIQGSIFNPPVRKSKLDFVVSHGVLHHLPDPFEGFSKLAPLIKKGGEISIWVYGLEGMDLIYKLSHFTFLRQFTRNLGPFACFGLSIYLALMLEISLWRPSKILKLFGFNVSDQIIENANLPFIWKIHEIQDRLGVPVTFYPTKNELIDWFDTMNLGEVKVIDTEKRGWFARGKRTL